MPDYQHEQSEAIRLTKDYLSTVSPQELSWFRARIDNYLRFRREVDQFLLDHFADVCTQKCYQDHYSACCSREGITTFFADILINVLVSSEEEIDRLLEVLSHHNPGMKCIYLGETGCLWRVKPIVCEMFLCEHARRHVFDNDRSALEQWERFRRREKRYTWPNRPVLFDDLEACFVRAGYSSSLMYFHNSPGLLRVKREAQNKRGSHTS